MSKIDPNQQNNVPTSYSNAGTAGGTFYYLNLGGIKMLWGTTTAFTNGTGGAGVTLPASFFSTIQTITATTYLPTVSGNQIAYIASQSTSTVSIGVSNNSGNATATTQVSIIVIGS